MSQPSRMLAFVSYLLSLPGALYVLLARRDDAFATFHARQSLALALAALATPLAWMLLAWALAWVPLVGPMLGVILFALVLAAYAGLGISWVFGMLYSLRGEASPIPLVGALAVGRRPAPAATSEIPPEIIERTSTSDA